MPLVQVDHLDALRRGGRQPAHHLGRVRRVGDEEHLVVVAVVGDQVVHHPAGGVVTAQRVLRLAGTHPSEVVGERGVDVRRRTRPAHHGLAEMADVEKADRLADGGVLLDDAAAGILDRHLPAAEVGHLRAQRDVAVVQRRTLGRSVAHRADASIAGIRVPTIRARSAPEQDGTDLGHGHSHHQQAQQPQGRRPRRRGRQEEDSGFVLLPGAEDVDKAFKGKLAATVEALGDTGAAERGHQGVLAGRDQRLPVVLAVCVGKAVEAAGKGSPSYDGEVLRRAAGAAARALAGTRRSASPCRPRTPRGRRGGRRGRAARGLRVPCATGSPRSSRTSRPSRRSAWSAARGRDKAVKAAVERAHDRRRGRAPRPRLGEHPAGRPAAGRRSRPRPVAAAKAAGLKVEVLDEKALNKAGYGGILGVGQGLVAAAVLVRLTYTARRAAARRISRWSARASPSTPAASRSSRRQRWRR